MSLSLVPEDTKPVSKVTFSPINTDALVVSIRTVVPKPGETIKMDPPRRSESHEPKRRSRSHRSSSEKSNNKSTMTDYQREISVASQTSVEDLSSDSSKTHQQSPCIKHAAQNLSFKAAEVPSEKVSLCNNCSKSMLSYICLVQDFLDSLAKEICGGSASQSCTQCIREQVRQEMIAKSEEAAKKHSKPGSKSSSVKESIRDSGRLESVKSSGNYSSDKIKPLGRNRDYKQNVPHQEPKTYSPSVPRGDLRNTNLLIHTPSDVVQVQSHYNHPTSEQQEKHYTGDKLVLIHPSQQPVGSNWTNQPNQDDFSKTQHPSSTQHSSSKSPIHQSQQPVGSNWTNQSNQDDFSKTQHPSNTQLSAQHHKSNVPIQNQTSPFRAPDSSTGPPGLTSGQPGGMFIKTLERQQPNFENTAPLIIQSSEPDSFGNTEIITSPLGERPDNIVSSFSSAEHEVYESARNGAGFENLSEVHEKLVGPDGRILSEAFVTMCRNNAEALGCLVVGTSLLLTQTSRSLCVLVSDGVSMAFREPLSSVFHIVQTVRSLDSLGTTKLALLEQPELGVTFDKLNVWRLRHFNKCVYLNPDTLVVQNCDELFNHEELSAVPDVGWPDCFNSGVFVFSPSEKTFWQLLNFSDKQESLEGGEQGLLNLYFSSWSNDINKKLSFIYNLMANVSYTYTPAFKQFGRNVKIVQFHGTFKPWHVKYFNQTGLISPASNVHPNYVEFVNKWIKIFKGNALRQLSQEIQSYANSQEKICAVELLRYFPLPTESEAEFFLTPPSVRLRLAEMKLRKTPKLIEEARRRKSAEFPTATKDNLEKQLDETMVKTTIDTKDAVKVAEPDASESENPEITLEDLEKVAGIEVVEDSSKLPGAEVGNYQGMTKWEQGKMDYQGTDSSDSIIKRLEFLMHQPK